MLMVTIMKLNGKKLELS